MILLLLLLFLSGCALRGQEVPATALTMLPGECVLTSGAGAPAGACHTCDRYLRTDGVSSGTYYVCEATAWKALGAGGGGGGDVFTTAENVFTNSPQTIRVTGEGARWDLISDWNTAAGNSQIRLQAYTAANVGLGGVVRGTQAGGTEASPSAVAAGSGLFRITGGGHDGTTMRFDTGGMIIEAPTAFSGTNRHTEISWTATPPSSTTTITAMRLQAPTATQGQLDLGSGGAIQGRLRLCNTTNASCALLIGTNTSTDGDISFFGEGAGTGSSFHGGGDGIQNLGLATVRWLNIYGVTGRFNNLRDPTDTSPINIKSFIPATGSESMGQSGNQWNNLYVNNIDSFGPVSNGANNIGSSTNDRFASIYGTLLVLGAPNTSTGSIVLYENGETSSITLTAANVTTATDLQLTLPSSNSAFYPSGDRIHDLGLVSREWQNVYSNVFRASGAYYGPSGVAGFSGTCLSTSNITVSGGVITGCP